MVNKGEFFLKGYTPKQEVEIEFNSFSIKITVDADKANHLLKLKETIEEASETAILTINGFAEQDTLRNLALDIKNLLSIALGRRVIFDNQKFWQNDQFHFLQIVMSKNDNRGEQIIPDFELKNFLASTLPGWTRLPKAEKDDLFTITDYLNQTRHDFIEDRILRTVQAWECSAFYWTKEMELPDDLKDLRDRIKQTYKKWKDERQFIDKDGELGTRLTSPLDQEKLMLRLDKLVGQSGLMVEKIGLNLHMLKTLRDQVAHTGRIKIKGDDAIKYLQPGINGLQLILLRRLGYEGKVNNEKNGWKTSRSIKEYFA